MTKYTGGCHCGSVKYEATINLNDPVMSCNCSICSKKGHLLAFASQDQFKLLAGESTLSDYQFYKKNIHHLFCKACGVGSFARGTGKDGTTMYAVNVRCLEGVDIASLKIQQVDGKSL